MATLDIRWVDDGGVNFQTVIKKATSTDGGKTWVSQGVIYNTNVAVPAGFTLGVIILDIDVGVPTQKGYLIQLPTSGSNNEQYVYIPSDSNPTPVAIDTTNKPQPPSAFGTQRNFWVDSNGNLWVVGLSPVLHKVTVYKSTNNGTTWTLMDAAHAISNSVVGNWYWDVVNTTKIQFIVADGSGFMALQEFDTATGLYTSVHGSNNALGTGWSLGQVVVNGSTIAVQYAAAASPFKASLAIFNGVSWNNVGQISNDTFLCTAGIDASGNSYLVHGNNSNPGVNPTMTVSVYSALGVHIGDAAFPAGSADGDLTGSPNNAVQQPYTDTPNGNMVFPTRCFTNGGQLNGATFLVPLGGSTISGPFAVQSGNISQFYGGQIDAEVGASVSLACPPQTQGTIGVVFGPSSLKVTGGTAPFTFALINGTMLPPGLTLNVSTGAISGTPTARGTFTFTIQVTDANSNTAVATCTITICLLGQVIFQGVRRTRPRPPDLIDRGCYKVASYNITASATISTLGACGLVNPNWPPVTVIQHIFDYPFEWHELKITYSSAGGTVPQPVVAMILYDAVKNQLSNLPVLDVFYNGHSSRHNGALVPPLIYPANSNIQADLFSLVQNPALLPVTVNLNFVGFQLIPK